MVALSARALAAAAHRSGYKVAALDCWHDLDLHRYCRRSSRYAGDWRRGFARGLALAHIDRALLAPGENVPVVYGAGFEDRPGILSAIAARHPVLGNDAETVRRVKRPLPLGELCRALGIPHPEVATEPPDGEGWLRKRAGGSGGGHVRDGGRANGRAENGADGRAGARAGTYWQQRVGGVPVSALFLADGRRALVLGFSRQWAVGDGAAPFTYAGAVRPAPESRHEAAMVDAVLRLAARVGLRGLNSVDFMVDDDGFHLIEVNPRPGASLDVFVHPAVMRMHVAACAGELPAEAPVFAAPAAAAQVVYAPRAMEVPPYFDWPEWCADLEARGRPIDRGAPVCTVLAEADDPHAARAMVGRRATEALRRMGVS